MNWTCPVCGMVVPGMKPEDFPINCRCQTVAYQDRIYRKGQVPPGTALAVVLHKLGFRQKEGCKCAERVDEMNRNGLEWCEKNVDTILGWLREEARRQGFIFVKEAARIAVKKALKNARRSATDLVRAEN